MVLRLPRSIAAALIVAGAALASCRGSGENATMVVAMAGPTMGATYSLEVVAASAADASRFRDMQAAVDSILASVDADMSTYRQDSALARLNHHAEATPFPVPQALEEVLVRAAEIHAVTDGAFDVTIAPLIHLWGFDRPGSRDAPPTDDEIAAALAAKGAKSVLVENGFVTKKNPRVTINLNAIAPGYAVDRIFAALWEAGARNLMVEVGGEVRVAGSNSQGDPWRIGINTPAPEAAITDVTTVATVRAGAVATSGTYRNFFAYQGRRYSHILDPRTGYPVSHDLVSATILASDCMTADGLATAAIVLGEERMRQVMSAMPGIEALFIHREGSAPERFTVSATNGFPLARNDARPASGS
ncbi:MAG: FAD:protein FMN transferase [Candidatus Schekmanbacteria bacterium]|nr:FAD:protein FMN transferase [Candidatus Schekmanbacteria bacterium]